MTDTPEGDGEAHLNALWRAADDAPPPLSAEALRMLKADAARLGRTLFWRDAREIGAALIAAAWFGVVALPPGPMRLPALGLVAVCGWVAAVLMAVRLRAPRPAPGAAPRVALAAEHRWLSAQTALLRWAGVWYVAPLTAGIVAFTFARPDPSPVYLATVILFAIGLVWLNVRAARALARTRDTFFDLLQRLGAHP